ncbi:MAG: GDSL-type esterase/lipase family protein [Lachnospiraceae bacterium]|nr:GDSL-type esterase/lipase family protein [Lachnospiraceae bacterium]
MKKKWIIPAACAVLLIVLIVLYVKGFCHSERAEADISIGRVLLAEQSEQSVEDAAAQISAVQGAREEAARIQREAEEAALQAQHEAEAAAQAAAEEAERQAYFEQWCAEADAMAEADQFKAVFAGSLMIGDSIAYGMLQTDLMFESSVVAEIGANLSDLTDLIPEVQSRNPSHIFLYCGFNDIGMTNGDKEAYYNDFVSYISQLITACPGVPIYISHLVAPLNLDTLENAWYGEVDQYNAIIDQVAAEYGLGVIETADLVKEEYYYKDGYHMLYPFYPKWLRRMAEAGGLM